MRKIILFIYAFVIFFLPFAYSRFTDQVFEINKFTFLLITTGIVSILFIFVALPDFVLRKQQAIAVIFFTVFLAFLTLSTFYSLSPLMSFWGSDSHHQGLILYLAIFLLSFYAILLQPDKKEFFRYFLLPLLVVGAVQSAFSIIQYFKPDFLFSDLELSAYPNRSFGTFGQPNYLARILLFPFFISFYYFIYSFRKWKKALFCLLFILIFFGILATKSRAGLIGLFFGLFLFTIVRAANWKQIILTFLGTILLGASISFIFYNYFTERGESADIRLYIWRNFPQISKEINPILGAGLESQEMVLEKIEDPQLFEAINYNVLDRAHNEIIDFIMQIGFVGAIFYLLFIGFALASVGVRNPLFVPVIASVLARMFGFFSVAELFIFFLFLFLIAFRNIKYGKRKIMPLYWSIFFIFAGVFFVYSASAINFSDRLYYQGRYLQAHQINPYDRKFAEALILKDFQTYQMEDAEVVIDELFKYHPYWAKTYYFASHLAFLEGDYQKAREYIDQAVLLYPESPLYSESQKSLYEIEL